MKRITLIIILLFICATTCVGAEIDGIWAGTVTGQDGNPLQLTYRFRAEGETLIGTVESKMGGGPFSEGKIKGNKISFVIDAGEFKIYTTGTIEGDVINLTEEIGEETIKLTLKRVPPEKVD